MARSFNGTTDFIVNTGGPTINISTTPVSIAAWFYWTGSTAGFPVIAQFGVNNNNNAGCMLGLDNVARVRGDYRTPGAGDTQAIGSSVSSDAWHHGVAVFPSGATAFPVCYTDGTTKNTGTTSYPGSSTPLQGSCIGMQDLLASGSFNFFSGRIAEVGVWNVVLTDAEVIALSKGARVYTIRKSALVAYYPLDGIRSPEPELSGNANNGTLTGTASATGPPLMMFTPRRPPFPAPIAPGLPPRTTNLLFV